MKRYGIFIILFLIIFNNSKIFAAETENLKQESESLEHVTFLGFSIIPYTSMETGNAVNNDRIELEGYAGEVSVSHITGLYYDQGGAALYLSLHSSLGLAVWNRQSIENADGDKVAEYSGIKVYSPFGSLSIRLNAVLFRAFGIYFEGGGLATSLFPENSDQDSDIDDSFRYGLTGGMGFNLFYPSRRVIMFDAGVSFANFIGDKDLLFCFKVTTHVEIF